MGQAVPASSQSKTGGLRTPLDLRPSPQPPLMKKTLAAVLSLMLLAIGCAPLAQQSAASTGKDTLYSDDFANTNSGWDRFQNDTGATDYSNVGYVIFIKRPNIIKWANPNKKFQNDIKIEVDAKRAEGPEDNAFGVICRYQDPDNFYYFYVSSDGYAGIGRKVQGTFNIISAPDGKLVKVEAVTGGTTTNHIRADCIGTSLSLYVNGTPVATAFDAAFSGGDVGLIARTYADGGADIIFSNFRVSEPSVPATIGSQPAVTPSLGAPAPHPAATPTS
jgi:hypothetical protein